MVTVICYLMIIILMHFTLSRRETDHWKSEGEIQKNEKAPPAELQWP